MKALEASCYTVGHGHTFCLIWTQQLTKYRQISNYISYFSSLCSFCLLFSVNDLFSKEEERQSPAHLGMLIASDVKMREAFCLYDLFWPPFT